MAESHRPETRAGAVTTVTSARLDIDKMQFTSTDTNLENNVDLEKQPNKRTPGMQCDVFFGLVCVSALQHSDVMMNYSLLDKSLGKSYIWTAIGGPPKKLLP